MSDVNKKSGQNINGDDELDLSALAMSLWAGKFWIALFAVITVALSVFYLLITPPTYQADALMQLEEKSGQLSLPTGLSDLVESAPESVTEIEILRSRMVLGKAVGDLNLDWRATPKYLPVIGYGLTRVSVQLPDLGFLRPFARGNERIRLDLLQVPPEWLGERITLIKGEGTAFGLELPNGQRLKGRVGTLVRAPNVGFAAKIGELEADSGRHFLLRQVSENAAISNIRANTSVSEKGRQSGILFVTYQARDPGRARQILHAITRAYLNQNVTRSAAEAESSLDFIETQLPEAEAAVSEAEQDLNEYRQSQTAIDLGFEAESLLTQIGQLETELSQIQLEEETLKKNYTPKHPVYKQLLDNKRHLDQRIALLREEAEELPKTQREVFDKTRNLELAEETYLQLLNRAQELRVLKASTIGNVRIIDTAHASPIPIAPRKGRILALGLLLGLMLGVGFVLMRSALHKGIQSSEQIEDLGIPVFATINKSLVAEGTGSRNKSWAILAVSNPVDLAVEAFRSLRTSLYFGMLDAQSKSVVITSSAPEAGKSFTSVNLAVVAAQAGKRVCLVDADLRRGQLRKYFNLKKDVLGLADYLSDKSDLGEVIRDTEIDGLSFIPAGLYPPNPSELLMRPATKALLKALDQDFDLIILDCPPVLAVTDPVILGKEAGAILTVVRFDKTAEGEVEALKQSFEVAGLQVTGAILNAFDPKKTKGGQYYYYNYRYSYTNRED
ncbi:MAG: polysaccharide biosynthesis tyrosine autokinase [Rhodobacteraceae bacterium]|nr:polysaccharide biosynthesis tyrosine autokinase [Paracoccaceae bacterium]